MAGTGDAPDMTFKSPELADIPNRVWAFDIETDVSGPPFDADSPPAGLDPRASAVLSAAFCGPSTGVYAGEEADVLDHVSRWLVSLEDDDVVTTWNGGAFDWPFLAYRYEQNGRTAPFRLADFSTRKPKYDPLPTTTGTQAVTFRYGGQHLDMAYPFAQYCADTGTSWSLKAVAASFGIDALVPDVTGADTGDMSLIELANYNLSDVDLTIRLAELWLLAAHELGDDFLKWCDQP